MTQEQALAEYLEGQFFTYTGNESIYTYNQRDPLQNHYASIRANARRAAVRASRNAAAAAIVSTPVPAAQTAILSLRPLSGLPMTDDQFAAGLSKMSTMLHLTAEVTGVSIADLKSFRRGTVICRARHIFFWLCRHYTSCSFPQIGNYLGKDHSTVVHGVKKVSASIALYPEIKKIKSLLGDCVPTTYAQPCERGVESAS